MKTAPILSFLELERKHTDDCLDAERTKTTESLLDERAESKRKTDQYIRDERSRADRVTSAGRRRSDRDRDVEREAAGGSLSPAQILTDEHVTDDRRRADLAAADSRSRIDAAFDRERDAKDQLISKLLGEERDQTDESLGIERDRTNAEVLDSTDALAREVNEHLQTRVALTTRDEFLGIVSHDLRNPIGAAASCVDMLLVDSVYLTMEPDELRRWFSFIKRNVDASLRLISDLLGVERMGSGKLNLVLKRESVRSMVTETVEVLRHVAKGKGIKLTTAFRQTVDGVLCDRDRIMQVLSNLVSNALKFTPAAGEVSITVDGDGRRISVAIVDTGAGIPADKISTIFDRFAQVSSGAKGGLGLGLYIAKMLVEAHGGTIGVTSAAGRGSAFTFELPTSRGA